MAAMQRGDKEAARDLLKAATVIIKIAARRTLTASRISDAPLIDDIVQETLLAVYDKRHTYDPTQPFIPWLMAIARYKAIDRLRRSKWRQTMTLDDTIDALPAPSSDPEVAIEVERLLATLPERSRRAVELVKLQGFSHAEAAAKLGVGEGALKVIVHRALRRLRGSAEDSDG